LYDLPTSFLVDVPRGRIWREVHGFIKYCGHFVVQTQFFKTLLELRAKPFAMIFRLNPNSGKVVVFKRFKFARIYELARRWRVCAFTERPDLEKIAVAVDFAKLFLEWQLLHTTSSEFQVHFS